MDHEVNSLAEIFEKEYFLMDGLNRVIYEDIQEWFVYSGSSRHMTRMKSIFMNFLESDTNGYIGYVTNTRKEIRGVGYVRFHIESGRFLGIEHMIYVAYLKVNLLLVSSQR